MPTTYEALVIMLLFVLPGFIMRAFLGKLPYSKSSDLWFIITSVFCSVIIYMCFGWWTRDIYLLYREGSLFTVDGNFRTAYLWLGVVVLGVPAIAGMIAAIIITAEPIDRLLARFGLSIQDRMPSAWDSVFASGKSYWVILELKTGERVAGKFADGGSAVAVSPSPKDIYIEEVYEIDENGHFSDKPIDGTRGAWIDGTEIKYIRFY